MKRFTELAFPRTHLRLDHASAGVCALAVAAACARAEPRAAALPDPAATTTAVPAIGPGASPSELAVAPVSPDGRSLSAVSPERAPVPFCVLGSYNDEPRLFRMVGDALLITGSLPVTACDGSGTCTDVAAEANVPDALALKHVIAAGGRWGREAWLTLVKRVGEGVQYRVVHLAAGRWREEMHAERGWVPVYQRMATSPDGRVVGIATFQVDGVHATAAQIQAGSGHVYRVDAIAGGVAVPPVRNNETPLAVALPGGSESLVLMERVVGGQGRALLLRTGVLGTREIQLPLPNNVAGAQLELHEMAVSPAGVAFVAGAVSGTSRGYLARVDAAGAASLEVPGAVGPIEDLAIESDETVWAEAGARLFARSPAGRWEQVPVAPRPGGSCLAEDVEVRAPGDVFVSARCGAQQFVLRTRCPR